ncbi:MAG: DUF302 domain-containing protein [Candidatus Eremiobacteraeota bacterium]|nr:DUF302 domain-containing protein [Candidatus Eremiobacteraeota bacterium]
MDGLLRISSVYDFVETCRRLEDALLSRSLKPMCTVDHSAMAKDAGLSLRPTRVYLFGNAKAGTPLMQAAETLGLDLPLRILVHQSEDGMTYVTHWLLRTIVERHRLLVAKFRDAIAHIEAVVEDIVSETVGEPLT